MFKVIAKRRRKTSICPVIQHTVYASIYERPHKTLQSAIKEYFQLLNQFDEVTIEGPEGAPVQLNA